MHFYLKALYEFEAVGQHRYIGIVENRATLIKSRVLRESEEHLLRRRRLFDSFSDSLRAAQVNETLARLYIATEQHALAQDVIERALRTFEFADGESLLTEALTTNGILASRLGRISEAKSRFEAAYKIAARCGDQEGADLALLTMVETIQISEELQRLLATTQQTSLRNRTQRFLENIPLNSSPPEK